MKNQFENLITFSYISGKNLAVITPPGWGKTSVFTASAKNAGVPFVKLTFSPTSPAEMVRGAVDIIALQQGQYKLVQDNTPFDPKIKIVILDELFRASDIVYDALLDPLENIDRDPEYKVFWSTNNFAPDSNRSYAMRERFALWAWMSLTLKPDDVKDIIGYFPQPVKLPAWNDVVSIRKTPLQPNQRELISDLIETAVQMGATEGFVFSPRIVTNMWETIHRVSVFVGGSNYTSLPKEAYDALKYLYPAASYEEAANWQKFVRAIINSDEVAIENILAMAKQKINAIRQSGKNGSSITELGKSLAEFQTELQKFRDKNPAKYNEAYALISEWFAEAIRGG